MIYITAATTTNLSRAYGILIQNNAALTGTITVNDSSTAKAIITNPVVGNQFRYYGFTGTISIVTSATCDITVSLISAAAR